MSTFSLVSPVAEPTADGIELRIRSPWYRSLPLSCVDLQLAIDDSTIDLERISFCVNGQCYALEEMHEFFDEFWFILDPARLRVSGVTHGVHEVSVRLGLRIPYLFDEETGDVLQLWSESTLTVAVTTEVAI